MAYKTIFTPLTEWHGTSCALAFAEALADAQDAHLEVMCLGIDRTPDTYVEIGSTAVVMHAAIEEAHKEAARIQKAVRAHLGSTTQRWDVISSIASTAGIGRVVATQARLSDLAVVSLPYGADQRAEDSLVLEGLLFEANCPTIVVPEGDVTARPEQVVIGWNESVQAIHAVRAALPFLQSAQTVHIVIVDPPEIGPERSDPGGALAVYLARHDVHCNIQVMNRQGAPISERLSRFVLESGSDMLVMGGYGHSRFREAILGGATRDMLEHARVPVLMVH